MRPFQQLALTNILAFLALVLATSCGSPVRELNDPFGDGEDEDIEFSAVCPTEGAHHTSASSGAGCQLVCVEGFANCNGDTEDSCEAELASDSGNCGECGFSCFGGTCFRGACAIVRASIDSAGVQADGISDWPTISADGRRVAFSSSATNLAQDDTNNKSDVFVLDRETNTVSRISIGVNGEQANGGSWCPIVNADGTRVVFHSWATNLLHQDATEPALPSFFEFDLTTGITSPGEQPAIEEMREACEVSDSYSWSDGRRFYTWAEYVPDASNISDVRGDVFLLDRETMKTTRLSQSVTGNSPNDHSLLPRISKNGHFVVFASEASNLVVGDTNGVMDIFVVGVPQ